MNIKAAISVLTLMGGLALAPASHAVVFDFANYADTYGEAGYTTHDITMDGITVTASAHHDRPRFAYFDGSSGGLRGGLGICKELAGGEGSECLDTSDDNARPGEEVHLVFDANVMLNMVEFRNREHGTTFVDRTDDLTINVDGTPGTYDITHMFSSSLSGMHFDFWAETNEFYISAIDVTKVAAPAPLALFGLGLLGIYGVSRWKKNA